MLTACYGGFLDGGDHALADDGIGETGGEMRAVTQIAFDEGVVLADVLGYEAEVAV